MSSSIRRGRRLSALVCLLTMTTAGAASAASGTYVRFAQRVDFFFGVSSGDAKSYDFSGYGTAKLCANAPTDSNSNYNVTYRKNRTMQPDEILKERFLAYSDPKYVSYSFDTNADNEYHTDATWSHVSGIPEESKGYSKAVDATC